MKKQIQKVGGLAALLTACGTAATAVQEPAVPTEERTFVCPEPDGATYFGTAALENMTYQIFAHDHDCDGHPTCGELYPLVPLFLPDGQQYPALLLVPAGFWLDANEDGLAQYEECTLKNNGPYASAPGDSL